MRRIKMVLFCLVIGLATALIGLGAGCGIAIALAFGWPQMLWVLMGIAIVVAMIVWWVYGRYQD